MSNPVTKGITEAEWMARLRKRLRERGGEGAEDAADAESFAVWSDGFEDDPEGAADEEMSYWADDGDDT